ncbi:Uncharacterised protein [Acinetobacter baumannii]|nr:Uncharacterised protein [Acinetobacter baumannii]
MCVGNIAGRMEAITPVKELSSTASTSRPTKIRPMTLLLIRMKHGIANANRPMLPPMINGLRPMRSLVRPITGCTNSMPIMMAMMIRTP